MFNSSSSGKTSFCPCFFCKWVLLLMSLCSVHVVPIRAADNLKLILQLMLEVEDPALHLDLLKGMRDGLAGRRNLSAPPSWKKVSAKLSKSPDAGVREEARLLGLVFDDETTIKATRSRALDAKAPVEERRRALGVLVENKAQGLADDLKVLLHDNALRIDALRGMAVFGGSDVPELVLARYGKLKNSEKREAVQLLVSRPAYAEVLLEALAAGVVPRSDVSVFAARQILGLGNEKLSARLKELWGEIRSAADAKKPLFAKYRKILQPKNLKNANLSNGRFVYSRTCAACHKLYGEGGAIGPDLTGSDRANLNYLLENVLDPNAAIVKDYLLNVLITKEGRVINGFITAENDASLTVQTVTGRILVSKQDLESRRTLSVSMMPEGIFQALEDEEVRDLVAYLFGKRQVALPKKKK
jgi:putative heme-binding domain-containing protein